MTGEGDRLGCALWLQSGINAKVLHRADETPPQKTKQNKTKESHEVRQGRLRSESMSTHDDDLSSSGRAQDDPPGGCFLVFLETEHAYTEQAKQNEGVSPGRNNKARESERKKVRTNAHIRPHMSALLIRLEPKHLRLDCECCLLVFLPFALPTLEPRRQGPRQPIFLQRALSRGCVASRRGRRGHIK